MDIIGDKITHALSLIFFPICIVCFVGAIVFGIRESRLDKARVKRIWMIPWVLGSYGLLLLGAFLLRDVSAKGKFDAMLEWKPDRLAITSATIKGEISDAAAIVELLRLIKESRKVAAHHSHSVDEMTLFFPQTGYTYSLGRDSQKAHEFWLTWVGYRDRQGRSRRAFAQIRQLRSEALEAWLEKYARSSD